MRLAALDDQQLAVAMVHPDTEDGDQIFRLESCSVLVVLRKQFTKSDERQYKVVGGAYVYDSKGSQSTMIMQEMILV